jgi:hypothetical protein
MSNAIVYPSYLLLGGGRFDGRGFLRGDNCLGFLRRLLRLGRQLVGRLDLHENASLDSALESGLQNMLLDGNLLIRSERRVGGGFSWRLHERFGARKWATRGEIRHGRGLLQILYAI